MKRKLSRMIDKSKYPKIQGWESVSDVAKQLGISSPALHQRILRKGVYPYRIGNQLVIKTEDIQKLK